MIPHLIHYCWYGQPIEESRCAMRCVASWARLSGCRIVEWNERNCPCTENDFVREAARRKAYAFISDYYRLKALYEHGGIYMDTDVEILKDLPTELYNCKCVLGFMFDNMVSSAFIMAEKGSPIVKGLLEKYERGEVRMNIANNELFTDYLKERYPNFLLTGTKQELESGVVIYPKEHFECPVLISSGGYAIHHFMGSWRPLSSRFAKLRKIVKWLDFNVRIVCWAHQNFGRWRSVRQNRFYGQYLMDRKKNAGGH